MLNTLLALGFTDDQAQKVIDVFGPESDEDLTLLTEADLVSLGIKTLPARQILKKIRELLTSSDARSAPEPNSDDSIDQEPEESDRFRELCTFVCGETFRNTDGTRFIEDKGAFSFSELERIVRWNFPEAAERERANHKGSGNRGTRKSLLRRCEELGHIDEAFFDLLYRQRPKRKMEIDKIRAMYKQP